MLLQGVPESCRVPRMDWKTAIETLVQRGMTPDTIGAEIGVGGNAIREILAGRTKAPRAEAAFKLAALCKRRRVPIIETAA